MPSVQLIRALLQHDSIEGSRSTALKPIGWMTSLLASATLAAFYLNTPSWVGILFAVSTGLSVLLYLVAYIYLMVRDRDALRSEKYSLQKLAIEKGLLGDDMHGFIEPEYIAQAQLPAGTSEESDVPE